MLKIDWKKDGDDSVLAFFKRNDQSVKGARHLECCGFIDPIQAMENEGFLPEISEFNAEAFLLVMVKRDQIPALRLSIAENQDKRDAGIREIALLDESILPSLEADTKSGNLILPVDLTKKSTILKLSALSVAEGYLLKDIKAIAQGSATYGSGGTYATRSLAYADIAAKLTGNLSFTCVSALTPTTGLSYGINNDGFTFSDDGANYKMTVSGDVNYSTITPITTAGIINLSNLLLIRDGTTLTTVRAMINLVILISFPHMHGIF